MSEAADGPITSNAQQTPSRRNALKIAAGALGGVATASSLKAETSTRVGCSAHALRCKALWDHYWAECGRLDAMTSESFAEVERALEPGWKAYEDARDSLMRNALASCAAGKATITNAKDLALLVRLELWENGDKHSEEKASKDDLSLEGTLLIVIESLGEGSQNV